jgi:hypothetical protein
VPRWLAYAITLLLLLACKTERKSKNDDIAACNAGGGRWVEGGCSDSGRCEKTMGAAPDDDDDLDAEEEVDDED